MLRPRYYSHPLIYPNGVEERQYQTAIAEAAKGRNTLVVLPTALGKTVISALVSVDYLYDYKKGRVLVMAPTRPLITQHRSSFRHLIRLPEGEFELLTGMMPSEYRSDVWSGKARVVFATPQVVRNDIREGRVDLRGFGLIIFDECHRAVKEYAYTEVAESYLKVNPYPRVLALTASPGSDPERIREVCGSLAIEHVESRSDTDPDVCAYINPVTVQWREVALPERFDASRQALRQMLESRIAALRARGHLRSGSGIVTRRQLVELGMELRFRAELSMEEERGPIYGAISLQSQGLTIYHMIELLESQGPSTLRSFVEKMESVGKRSTASIVAEGGYRVIKQLLESETVEHPKVGELISLVDEQLRKNKESRILVFTQYRDTASHLVEALNRVEGVRAERFVGQAMKIGDRGLTQGEQSRMIDDFRRGTINLLCATSVGEEGLDIPEVDLVVFYEPVPSEIRYIQRRGRTGRRMPGRVMILASAGTSDEAYLDISRFKAERMKTVVQSLNKQLRPVIRLGKMPPREPMTEAELERLRQSFPDAPTTQEVEDADKIMRFDSTVRRAMQALYMRVLETDMKGLSSEELISDLESDGFSRRVSELALKRLTTSRRLSGGIKKVWVPIQEIPGAKVMTVTVLKIALGVALVMLDGSFEARLESSNYDGPRELIKKGSSFRALCELYESSGELNVNIRQVVGLS